MTELTAQVESWAKARGLNKGNPMRQFAKLAEEVGELAGALVRKDENLIIDSIGDIEVVLIILVQQLRNTGALESNLTVGHCLQYALNEIMDRKGQMIDGVFVKASDLNKAID